MQNLIFEQLSKHHSLMAALKFLLMLDHIFSVDTTGIDGRIPARAAACSVLLEVT